MKANRNLSERLLVLMPVYFLKIDLSIDYGWNRRGKCIGVLFALRSENTSRSSQTRKRQEVKRILKKIEYPAS